MSAAVLDRDRQLVPATLLQTTLDPQRLVALFSEYVAGWVRHVGLRFTPPCGGPECVVVRVDVGRKQPSGCRYRLRLGNAELGAITFFCEERFSPPEMERLEAALAHLIHPLHNALRYQEALAAALWDPLTRVHNRAGFESMLPRAIGIAQRCGTPLCVIMVDIDNFKAVNDRFGHLVGDTVLAGFTRRIQAYIRRRDRIFRFGGEEFAIVAADTALADAVLLAERLRVAVAERPFATAAGRVRVTASFGVTCRRDGEPAVGVLTRADDALYTAKVGGRNHTAIGR